MKGWYIFWNPNNSKSSKHPSKVFQISIPLFTHSRSSWSKTKLLFVRPGCCLHAIWLCLKSADNQMCWGFFFFLLLFVLKGEGLVSNMEWTSWRSMVYLCLCGSGYYITLLYYISCLRPTDKQGPLYIIVKLGALKGLSTWRVNSHFGENLQFSSGEPLWSAVKPSTIADFTVGAEASSRQSKPRGIRAPVTSG